MAGTLLLCERLPTAEVSRWKHSPGGEGKVFIQAPLPEDCLDETQPNSSNRGAIYGITEYKAVPGPKCIKEGSYWTTEYCGAKTILIWKFTIMVQQFCFKYSVYTEGEVFLFQYQSLIICFASWLPCGSCWKHNETTKGMLDSLIEKSSKQMLVMNSYQIY